MVHLQQKHLKADVYEYPLVPLAQPDSFNPQATEWYQFKLLYIHWKSKMKFMNLTMHI